ncbi:MAG TPA: DUF4124 domain-containing protein [Methylotenera sp.]|nr:DUF4124 domain-containing protein [Methylotenera sp.]HPH05435.1 DUF4124 domain-containing protein [Methylotenera sp.]HPN02310.1 DUF4124 domain-containing protein [Methylotenera sp.]
MKKYLFLLAITISTLASHAMAEIYKHVDADGRITYTNIKTKGATRLDIDPDANVIKNNHSRSNKATSGNNNGRTATPSDFPKVDKETQSSRDSKRQEILQSELEAEKIALEQAKKAYAEGQANPEIAHQADGKTYRNMAKYNEKMKNLQADVDGHESNIKLLEKEISSLK